MGVASLLVVYRNDKHTHIGKKVDIIHNVVFCFIHIFRICLRIIYFASYAIVFNVMLTPASR